MNYARRVVALTTIAFLSSCGTNSSMNTIPQTAPNSSLAQQSQTTQTQATSADTAVAPVPQATRLASGEIFAGPGFSDVSPHQIVRTSGNVLYVATPSCTSYPNCYNNSLAMEAGNKTGIPTSYVIKDAAHQPKSLASNDAIGSSALAMDGHGTIWVAYNTRNEGTHVKAFDTSTGLWGKDYELNSNAGGGQVTQGKEGVAMVVSRADTPRAIFTFVGSDHQKHIAISSFMNNAWTSSTQIDDTKLGSGQGALHPTVAYTANDEMLVAWLVGNENATYNNPDGTIHVRTLTGSLNTTGPASVEIPDTSNDRGHPGYAATVIDNGPSMLVTADGVARISYIDTSDYIRYWYSNGTNYASWNGSRQPAQQQTHDPSLGPDGSGGVFVYGHGTPAGNLNGHGNNLYRMHLSAGSSSWSGFDEVISDNNIDCSVSTRWSQYYNYFPTQIDFLYWDDHEPNMNYATAM